MQITRGKQPGAQKIVIYGPEGIGKSTFASYFPNPVFIDTEGSTRHMDVARLPKPTSWAMLLDEVQHIRDNPTFETLVIDTADWAEALCITAVCARAQMTGIESFGFGKGYVFLSEEYGKLLNLLNEVIERHVHVVITAHAWMKKVEQPDELGSYDKWEMKLGKKTGPLVKEWADAVLFANYKTYVINVDGQGAAKGKNKVQGGKRVIYTSHHPCWDAKNRYGLEPEIPMEFAAIAQYIDAKPATDAVIRPELSKPEGETPPPRVAVMTPPELDPIEPASAPTPIQSDSIPTTLRDLMLEHGVLLSEIQQVVAERGYYPKDTPIANYDPDFIDGVLVGAWPQVHQMILLNRDPDKIPF